MQNKLAALVLTAMLLGLAGDRPVGAAAERAAPTPSRDSLASCPLYPADNIWNTPVDTAPLHPLSRDYVATIGANTGLHPDFGSTWEGQPIGIPYNLVPGSQPKVPVEFYYDEDSDPGPYAIPPGALIEGGPSSDGDRHVLVLDQDNCILYEMWDSHPNPDGSWYAGSGAIFDMRSNALRPAGYTSADAAGLPILPGLVRYDELAAGKIEHAIRFTAALTQQLYVWPARHYASSSTDPARPPMGQRFRLKGTIDLSSFSPETQVILKAMQTYGIILADNGSNWYITGTYDERWDDNELLDTLVNELRRVRGSDFEAVDVSGLMLHPDSGQIHPPFTGDQRLYLPLIRH